MKWWNTVGIVMAWLPPVLLGLFFVIGIVCGLWLKYPYETSAFIGWFALSGLLMFYRGKQPVTREEAGS